jgi:hypothetical protein
MQFFTWTIDFDNFKRQVRRDVSAKEFYPKRVLDFQQHNMPSFRLVAEYLWEGKGRPYYNIHPKLVGNLGRTNLEKIPADLIQLPHDFSCVHIRFAQRHKELTFQNYHSGIGTIIPKGSFVHGLLMADLRRPSKMNVAQPVVLFVMDLGITREWGGYQMPFYMIFFIQIDASLNLQESLDRGIESLRGADKDYYRVAANALKIAVTIGFLSNSDSKLIEYDVLSKYRSNFQRADETKRKQIIDKSRRKGKVGWNVGNDLIFTGALSLQQRTKGEGVGMELNYAHIR